MPIVTMKQLLESGVHFGHRSRRWNPKMRSFIFTERNGIHIIDLQQTIRRLQVAADFVRDLAAEGGTIIFVGTKRQAQENVSAQAQRCGMPFVTQRWLGGTLTNFRTIRSRIDYMLDLEHQRDNGEFEVLLKKEAMGKLRDLAKLERRLGGLRNLHRLPEAVFVTDTSTEDITVREANRLGIPVVAMVDTNCDPDPIDYIIPANDDAIRSILLMSSVIAEAVIEGQQMRGVIMEEESEDAMAPVPVAEAVSSFASPEPAVATPVAVAGAEATTAVLETVAAIEVDEISVESAGEEDIIIIDDDDDNEGEGV